MQSDIAVALKPVAEAFRKLNIPYAVGGSVASSTYGLPRSTLDIDVVANIPIDKARSFYDLLYHDYYIDEEAVREAIKNRTSFNVIHLGTMTKVDVFILENADYHRQAFERLRTDTLAEQAGAGQFSFVAPEDVILNKLMWYRMGNEISERQWNDVLGVLKVQKKHLDLEYLKRWAVELDVADLLERALREAKCQEKERDP